MYVLKNDFAHLPVHPYTTHHANSPPPSLRAVYDYIIAMKIQVLEMLVYCCMFVAIKYIQKNSFDVGPVKNKRLLSVRTMKKLCHFAEIIPGRTGLH
jgi:capsule polysaccharide export protein KpsE/RkpR